MSGADRQADFPSHAAAASAALPVRKMHPRDLLTAPAKCARKFVCDRRTAGVSTLQRMTDNSPSNPSPLRRQPLYLIDFAWNRRLVSGLSAARQSFV
jgi:hypothetical protein